MIMGWLLRPLSSLLGGAHDRDGGQRRWSRHIGREHMAATPLLCVFSFKK
jgi:hypothetical protein